MIRPAVSRSSFYYSSSISIMMRRQRHASAALLVSSFHVTASSRKQNASYEKSGTAATPTRRHQQECAFLNCFSCRRSNLSSSKSITRYRKFCSGAVSSPVIVCVNDRPVICNVSAYASDCGRLLISSFTVVKHVLLLVEPFWPEGLSVGAGRGSLAGRHSPCPPGGAPGRGSPLWEPFLSRGSARRGASSRLSSRPSGASTTAAPSLSGRLRGS